MSVPLMFSCAGAQVVFDGQLEPGTGPIFLDRVSCDGSESQLLDCIMTMAPHTCDHSEDVFISCQGDLYTTLLSYM